MKLKVLALIIFPFLFNWLPTPTSIDMTESIASSDYLIVYSDSLEHKSGYCFIDDSGKLIGKTHKLKMQDLHAYAVVDHRLVLSGARANNSLILDRGKADDVKAFYFLDNPRFTGVTAVTADEDALIASMNGGFSEDRYQTLLVRQKPDEAATHQHLIDLYPRTVIASSDHVVAAGFIKKRSEMFATACIADCDFETTHYQEFPQYTDFNDAIVFEDAIVCIASSQSHKPDTVVKLRKDSFEYEDEITIHDELCALFAYDGEVYAVGNRSLYVLNFEASREEILLDFKPYVHRYSWIVTPYVWEDHLYVLSRFGIGVDLGDGSSDHGELLKINLSSLQVEQVPIILPENLSVVGLFVIPSAFLRP